MVSYAYQMGQKIMSGTILPPAPIYGPGDPERFFMIYKRVTSGTFPMFGAGRERSRLRTRAPLDKSLRRSYEWYRAE
jgi:hypothetical protein